MSGIGEFVGLASGLVALADFTFRSTIALYDLVSSFKGAPKSIRELRDELKDLIKVLQPLQKIVAISSSDLDGLERPLLQCGTTCREFKKIIDDCTMHSKESKTSFRDWLKLRYKEKDITALRNLLASYKSTINIAVSAANLRNTSITVEKLEDLKSAIADAKSDIQEQVLEIQRNMEDLSLRETPVAQLDALQKALEEDEEALQQSLVICGQAEQALNMARPKLTFEDVLAEETAVQMIGSSNLNPEYTMEVRRVTAGARSHQAIGTFDAATLQKMLEVAKKSHEAATKIPGGSTKRT